jgi:hypothetical protein
MDLDLQIEMFEQALDELTSDADLVNQVLEITLDDGEEFHNGLPNEPRCKLARPVVCRIARNTRRANQRLEVVFVSWLGAVISARERVDVFRGSRGAISGRSRLSSHFTSDEVDDPALQWLGATRVRGGVRGDRAR